MRADVRSGVGATSRLRLSLDPSHPSRITRTTTSESESRVMRCNCSEFAAKRLPLRASALDICCQALAAVCWVAWTDDELEQDESQPDDTSELSMASSCDRCKRKKDRTAGCAQRA